jgi:hypothetical protein
MAERNARVPANQRIDFRIGINVGDFIIDGEDILGDGVTAAARLQTLAETRRNLRKQGVSRSWVRQIELRVRGPAAPDSALPRSFASLWSRSARGIQLRMTSRTQNHSPVCCR